MRFLLRRFFHAAFLLLGVSVLSFLLVEMAPGNYLDEMKLNPQISAETVEALRVQYGMNQSLPVRYGKWVRSVLRGEWGFSFAYNLPVTELLLPRARNTLLLTITSAILTWLIALPLGIWAAERRGEWPGRVISGATSFLLAVPDVLLALVLLLFVIATRALPAGGMAAAGATQAGVARVLRDLLAHLLLPVVALVLTSLPVLIRHIRAAVTEQLDAPFVFAARGHGIGRRRILYRYVLRAAANPLITLFGFSVAGLLSGSLLIEVIFGWPGMGPLLLEAILSRDLYVVVGAVLFSTLFLVAGNVLADVLLYWADPRIRTEQA